MSDLIFKIISQDRDILVVEKKKAFIAQRSDNGSQEAFYEFISRSIGDKLFPVHRLDREVLGLMIFAKNQKTAKELSDQFRERIVKKIYWAWVCGRVHKENDQLLHYLLKNPKKNLVTAFPRPTPGAKAAELYYQRLRVEEDHSLLELELKTGRSHQIRVQLAKIGHPIIGDSRYLSSKNKRWRERYLDYPIQLKSMELGIQHPTSGEKMRWRLDLPEEKFFE